MISPKNSFILAFTKLKVRKIRTIITVIVAGLTFSALFFLVIIFDGVYLKSLNTFSKQTLSSRNILRGQNISHANYSIGEDEKNILDKMLDQEIAKRTKRARELGLDFNPKEARQSLAPYREIIDGKRRVIEPSYGNAIYESFIQQKNAKEKSRQEEIMQAFIVKTKAIKNDYGINLREKNSSHFIKKDGKYDFGATERDNKILAFDNNAQNTPSFGHIHLAPSMAYQPFLFKNHNWQPSSNTIPILLPANNLENLLNLQPLPKNSDANKGVKRLKEIQEKSQNLKFSVCYLNDKARANHQLALAYRGMSDKEKAQVRIAYAPLDNNKCSVPAIIKDNRTKFEKEYANKTAQFAFEFDHIDPEPRVEEFTFQVVGILPYNSFDFGFVDYILRTLSGQINDSGFVPIDLFAQSKEINKFKKFYTKFDLDKKSQKLVSLDSFSSSYYLEYQKPEEAKFALDMNTCINDNNYRPVHDQNRKCADFPKINYFFRSFGSRNAELLKIKEIFNVIIKIATIVVVIFATIIMAGTVGRVISDSRRETAVFRAIGFKRFDISSVYLCYSFILSLSISLFSFLAALVASLVLDHIYSPELTARSVWIYNIKEHSLKFSLVGFSSELILPIVVMIFITGLIATAFPLLRNIRRNPIKDMRDE